jgi:hypothetical protein
MCAEAIGGAVELLEMEAAAAVGDGKEGEG